jgi:PAS domain S-box-containing protein
MQILSEDTHKKQPGSLKSTASVTGDRLRRLAFDHSLQANIISVAATGKIIIVNKAACLLLGYSEKELLTKSSAAILDINEPAFIKMLQQRKNGEQQSAALVTVIKKNGRPVPCEITSAVFTDENGVENEITTISDRSKNILKQKNIDSKKEKITAGNIVLAQSKQENIDVEKEKIVAGNIVLARSKQKNIDLKKEKIVAGNIILAQAKADAIQAENNTWKKYIGKTSYDVMWDWDIATGQIYVSDSIAEVFGYKVPDNTVNFTDFQRSLVPEEKEAVEKKLLKTLTSGTQNWNDSYRFKRQDGSVAYTTTRASIIRNEAGKAIRLIGAIQDISRLQKLELKLEQEIKLREEQIAEASDDAKNMERSDIGKELHDNINQLLVASRMYLEMAKRGGKDREAYLSRSSEYTINAIEEIRKLTRGLTTVTTQNIGLCEAIDKVIRDTMEVNPVKISRAWKSFKEDSVNDKFKLTIFRIVQEHLNNILKHAKATEVIISFSQNKKNLLLSISDNGVGFDTNKPQKGIGVTNIKSRAASYNGTADFVSQPGRGCVLTVNFPVKETQLNAE